MNVNHNPYAKPNIFKEDLSTYISKVHQEICTMLDTPYIPQYIEFKIGKYFIEKIHLDMLTELIEPRNVWFQRGSFMIHKDWADRNVSIIKSANSPETYSELSNICEKMMKNTKKYLRILPSKN